MKKLLFMGAFVAFLAASCGTPSPKEEEKLEPFALGYVKEQFPGFPEEFFRYPHSSIDSIFGVFSIINKGASSYDKYDLNVYYFENSEEERLYKIVDSRNKKVYVGAFGFLKPKGDELRQPVIKERVFSEMYWISRQKDSTKYDTNIYEKGELIDSYSE